MPLESVRASPVWRWAPLVVTAAAVGALWFGFPETRRIREAPGPPWAAIGWFAGCYVLWTGLRGVRYWLLLGGPATVGRPVVAIAYVHHAAIDFLPFRSGVLTYPVLSRFLTGMRWRRILASMVGASLGDVLATALYLQWFLPWEVGLALWGLTACLVGLGVSFRRFVPTWFRRRHRMRRDRFRAGWWAWVGLSLIFQRRTPGQWGLWAALSVAIVTLKYVGLTVLYHGWVTAYGMPSVSVSTLFQALVAAELSREIPLHGWLHLGTWELAWLAVTGSEAQAPVALLTHVTYEAVILLSALPAALYLAFSEGRPLPIRSQVPGAGSPGEVGHRKVGIYGE
ncbi:hypothetical protein HRbin11_01945 [bacterium HR11]|nr:hypothetical protein HRbin11_01945 [bacterium HR11]